ncbi:BsuPI-related putative proteinase inhibitor [Aquibacillus koreensis]|uniref:Intracellular proteinase inhibitor BsuPI domain-containing protein n=1 Tax=Aquibacillus koreensis TaxID=279446 RepID=A0A9X3WI07_9BACI|nr:BsuPI-related putative proteinase inhibitor [Aquibacillus koreensis]MCT2535620.1 BsuPI-related putative proteinase inhibitor [Aquibacillus koreensis]MDC3420095.1 BsuPI-related putative proteinase inhibitor [Aquibacillus koreensis]
MKAFLYILSALLFLVLMACGTKNDEEYSQGSMGDGDPIEQHEMDDSITQNISANQATSPDVQTLIEQLEMKVDVTTTGEKVVFTMQLKNTGDEQIELSFSSGQQFEIEILDETDDEIYVYSEGKMFTEALVYEPLAPGERLEWQEEIDIVEEGLTEGVYQGTVTLLPTEVNKQLLEDNPFTETISMTIGENHSEPLLPKADDTHPDSFRDVEVTGTNGIYTVTGEAYTSNDFFYHVEDGHMVLVEETKVEKEVEGWESFQIDLSIDEKRLPENGAVTIFFYEKNLEDGMEMNGKAYPLEQF